jgi:hypothetical protein
LNVGRHLFDVRRKELPKFFAGDSNPALKPLAVDGNGAAPPACSLWRALKGKFLNRSSEGVFVGEASVPCLMRRSFGERTERAPTINGPLHPPELLSKARDQSSKFLSLGAANVFVLKCLQAFVQLRSQAYSIVEKVVIPARKGKPILLLSVLVPVGFRSDYVKYPSPLIFRGLVESLGHFAQIYEISSAEESQNES